MKRPYVIFGYPYSKVSNGVKALYRLCSMLSFSGYDAVMKDPNDHTDIPEDAIAVYPEVVKGNPFGARHVARWVLNSPGLLGGDKTYHPDEMVFKWSEVYQPYIGRQADTLFVSTIEREIFKPPAQERRSWSCYYLGRMVDRVVVDIPGIEITPVYPATREGLALLFKHSECFFSFVSTVLIDEARLCGCPVVYTPSEPYAPDLSGSELGMVGICTNVLDIGVARMGLKGFGKRYDEIEALSWKQVSHFIEVTQCH